MRLGHCDLDVRDLWWQQHRTRQQQLWQAVGTVPVCAISHTATDRLTCCTSLSPFRVGTSKHRTLAQQGLRSQQKLLTRMHKQYAETFTE